MVLHSRNIAYFSFCILVVVLPFELIYASIALGILMICTLLFSEKKDFKNLIEPHKVYVIATYFLFVCAGLLYTSNMQVGLDRMLRQLPLLLLPICVVLLNMDQREKQAVKRLFVYSCLVLCVLSLTTLLYNYIDNYNLRFQYNFVQANMYHFHYPYDSLYINIAYVFLLFGAFSKFFKKIVSIVFFIVIFLFGVRIGILTFCLVSFVFLMRNIGRLLKIKNIIGVLLIAVLVGSLLYASPYAKDKYYDTLFRIGLVDDENITEIGKEYHKINLRQSLWSSAVALIKEKPLFGHGTAGEVKLLKDKYIAQGLKNRDELNSHNQYLTTALQHGIVGLVFLMMAISCGFFYAFKRRKIDNFLVLAIFAIGFITESYLLRQKGILVFGIFLSMFLHSGAKLRKIRSVTEQRTYFMNKYKIAHILNSVGGVDVSLRLILENMDSMAFESIVVHGMDDTSKEFQDNQGNTVKEYKISIMRDINLIKDIKSIFEALRIVRKEKPDLIHAHSAKGGILGKVIGNILGIPVLHTPQAYSYLSVGNGFKRSIYLFVEKLTSIGRNKVLASSESEKNRALTEVRYSKENVLLFNNSIVAPKGISSLSIDKTWPSNYICSVGRPSYQKNIEMMLRVLSGVKEKHSDIHLVLMGIGYHSPNVESVNALIVELDLKENITLLPWTSREDIFHIISNSKFYISTARYEGLPYSIIETLMLGKACIATDCDGNRDLVKDAYNGFLVPMGDVLEMTKKVEELYTNSELLQKFESNSKTFFENNFNMRKNIKDLEAIYTNEISTC